VLIDLGLREKTLREELFLQVIKQTTGNPDPAAAREGWTLLVFFCSVFLPTKVRRPPCGCIRMAIGVCECVYMVVRGCECVSPSHKRVFALPPPRRSFATT
jgi:hypothetical protein